MIRAGSQSPEVVVHALTALLTFCSRSNSMQDCLVAFLTSQDNIHFCGMLPLLKSPDTSQRSAALQFILAYCDRVVDVAEDLGILLKDIGSLLGDSKAQNRYMHRAAVVSAVSIILRRVRASSNQTNANRNQLDKEEIIQLCELASAPVRSVIEDEDHLPTKAFAMSVLGQCSGAGGQVLGTLSEANANCIRAGLKNNAMQSHAIHALAESCGGGALFGSGSNGYATPAPACCEAVAAAFERDITKLFKEKLTKTSPVIITEVVELAFVLMSIQHTNGSLDATLSSGGGLFKKFLMSSSDIYSFAMHKKVWQASNANESSIVDSFDAPFCRFQVALMRIMDMVLSSPSSTQIFDPRAFLTGYSDRFIHCNVSNNTSGAVLDGESANRNMSDCASNYVLTAPSPHPMIDLCILLLHSPLTFVRRHVADFSLKRGILRSPYAADISVHLLRRILSFLAQLKCDDAWRHRSELHLAAVKACIVSNKRNFKRGTKKQKRTQRQSQDHLQSPSFDLEGSRAARFAIAATLVACCHPYCHAGTSPVRST